MCKGDGTADKVRAIFAAAPDLWIGHGALFEALGVSKPHLNAERMTVREALKYLVKCGFLIKTGRFATAAYRYSGKGMPGKAASAKVSFVQVPAAAVVRDRRMDGNTVARPKVGKAAAAAGVGETVEQFQARGGQVQRLTASWEQRA